MHKMKANRCIMVQLHFISVFWSPSGTYLQIIGLHEIVEDARYKILVLRKSKVFDIFV